MVLNKKFKVKKTIIYITVFLLGVSTSYFYFKEQIKANSNKKVNSLNYVSRDTFALFQKNKFTRASEAELCSPVIVSGIVKEVYTNNNKELVVHIRHKKIPIEINCTLADTNIKKPLKLGQEINVKGILAQLDEQIFLKSCSFIDIASID